MCAHPSGQWARKIKGKLFYFGVWADPDAALQQHDLAYPYLKRDETPPLTDAPKPGEPCTLAALANDFLDLKESRVRSGELTALRLSQPEKNACREILAGNSSEYDYANSSRVQPWR
jgi:hypothetical protein